MALCASKGTSMYLLIFGILCTLTELLQAYQGKLEEIIGYASNNANVV